MMAKIGRPTLYTDELADRICELVATHTCGLPKLCEMYPDLPNVDTIKEYRYKYPLFSAKYNTAKRFQAELMAEEINDIIENTEQYMFHDEHGNKRLDSGVLGLTRLKIDARRWHASKLAPKLYGDRTQVDATVNHETTIKELE